jgi:hypothetical protein
VPRTAPQRGEHVDAEAEGDQEEEIHCASIDRGGDSS